MAEEREEENKPEGECPLVGEHEDGRIFPTKMSLPSWRRNENARRAGEETREAMRAFTKKDAPLGPKRNRNWQKPRSGGGRTRRAAKAKVKAATEALETARGEAVEAAAA